VTDGASRWALRRPPLGHVLPTAHNMAREFRIISALHDTAVPVAGAVALCQDPDVIGAPFYLMGFVDGVVLDRPDVLASVTREQAARSCELLVDTLLALHAIDPEAIGLGDFGRPAGFLDRQVRRWTAQWQASVTRQLPDVEWLVGWLTDRLPEQSGPGIVHGDYRLTNIIYSAGFTEVAAVVDWEMATVGDPLTDVGLVVVYQELSNAGGFVMPHLAVERGFVAAADLVARYSAGSDRDLSHLAWYVAFGWFKLAVIAEGIHARFLQGKTVGKGFEGIGTWVPHLVERGLLALGPDDGRGRETH
jgi:aminoglycoside phosphotransferase (APT) family kinase protein